MTQQFDNAERRRLATAVAKLTAEERAARRRFYIRLNPKPKRYDPGKEGRHRWGYDVWPILFTSREQAEEYMRTHNVFRGGRHGSASVEVTLLPKE